MCACGRNLGSLAELIVCIMRDINRELIEKSDAAEIQPTNIPYAHTIHPDFSELFTACGLELECCKKNVFTCIRFHEHY